MSLSFQNFYNYLKTINWINVDLLHSVFFSNICDVEINSQYLATKLHISDQKAFSFMKGLYKFSRDSFEPIECPKCGKYLEDITFHCDNCNEELDETELLIIKQKGCETVDNQKEKREKYIKELQCKKLINKWIENKEIYYLLLDISKSEKLQRSGDETYNTVLHRIREIIEKYAIGNLTSSYLLLGEVGDCFKIAFTTKKDLMSFMKIYVKHHMELKKEYIRKTGIQDDVTPYVNVVVGIVPLPTENGTPIAPEKVISITMSGSIDINSVKLTELFRKDSSVHLDYEKAFSDNNYVCLWGFDGLLKEWETIIQREFPFPYGKHDTNVAKAVLFRFPNGELKAEENPAPFVNVKKYPNIIELQNKIKELEDKLASVAGGA